MERVSSSAGTHTTISTHVPRDLAEELVRLARSNDRSASGEIRLALRRHLDAARRDAAKA